VGAGKRPDISKIKTQIAKPQSKIQKGNALSLRRQEREEVNGSNVPTRVLHNLGVLGVLPEGQLRTHAWARHTPRGALRDERAIRPKIT